MKQEAAGFTEHFHSPCNKGFGKGSVHNSIRIFVIFLPFAVRNTFVFRDGFLEGVGNERFVPRQYFKVLLIDLLIDDMHFNIRKEWRQKFVQRHNQRIWRIFHHFVICRIFDFIFFSFILVLYFSFLGIASCVTTTFTQFHFQSQDLTLINVKASIHLKFKFHWNFTHWSSKINIAFEGWQDIISHWNFPSAISRIFHERLVTEKLDRISEKCFEKHLSTKQLVSFAGNVGMTLLAGFTSASSFAHTVPSCFLPRLPNSFLRVCFTTFSAANLKRLPSLTTYAESGVGNSNKSAPTHLAAGTTYLCKNVIKVLPVPCATAPFPSTLSANTSV